MSCGAVLSAHGRHYTSLDGCAKGARHLDEGCHRAGLPACDHRIVDVSAVVNGTSIRLSDADADADADARLALDPDSLRPDMVVADVIPNPPRTALLRDARERGCRVLDGLGMPVGQGVGCIRHWTGAEADPGVMRRALEMALWIGS